VASNRPVPYYQGQCAISFMIQAIDLMHCSGRPHDRQNDFPPSDSGKAGRWLDGWRIIDKGWFL